MNLKVDTNPSSASLPDNNNSNSLANCLLPYLGNKSRDVLLQQFCISSHEINQIAKRTAAVLICKKELRDDNVRHTLKRLFPKIKASLESHQRLTRMREANIFIQPEHETKRQKINPEYRRERLLTKSEYKHLKMKVYEELRALGVSKPLITEYNFYCPSYNKSYVLVQSAFEHLEHADLDQIRSRVQKMFSHKMDAPNFTVEFSKKSPPISERKTFDVTHAFSVAGTNEKYNISEAVSRVKCALNSFPEAVRDLRDFRLLGMDGFNIRKPEDIHGAIHLPDGMQLISAFPAEISEQECFRTGVECLVLCVDRTLDKQGIAKDIKVSLGVAAQNAWISYEKGDDYLDAIEAEYVKIRKQEVRVFNDFYKLNEAAKLTAGHAFVNGIALEEAFQSATETDFTQDSLTSKIDFTSNGLISHLISSSQRDFATAMVRDEIPVIVRRQKVDFSNLQSDFERVFGKDAGILLAMCAFCDKTRYEVMHILNWKKEEDLIRVLTAKLYNMHYGTSYHWTVVNNEQDLQPTDRAPIKPGHGSLQALVNQIQIAAHCLGEKEMIMDFEYLKILTARMNLPYANTKMQKDRKAMESKSAELQKILYPPKKINYRK